MSCVAGVTLFKNKCTLHCVWDILQKAYFSFSVGSWCQSSAVLICHQIKELTERYWLEHLVVSPLIMMSSPFASFLAYKLENSPFRILWNIKSFIFATNFLVPLDSQTCGSIVWSLAKMTLRSMKVEEGYTIWDTWTENQRSVHNESRVI